MQIKISNTSKSCSLQFTAAIKPTHSLKNFGFNITHEDIMSYYWEL